MRAPALRSGMAIVLGIIGPSLLRATSGLAEQLRETTIGPSVLRATRGLAEQLRETTIFGILV